MNVARVSRIGSLGAPPATLAGLLALGAAAVHLAMAPAHFQEWWGYGWLFLVVAALQVLYGLGMLVPRSPFPAPDWYLLAGIVGSLLIMAVYAISRTLGVPFLGPHAGHVESVGLPDLLSSVLELGLVGSLTVLLLRQKTAQRNYRVRNGLAVLFGGLAALGLLLAVMSVSGVRFGAAAHDRFGATAHDVAKSEALPGSSAHPLPTVRELLPQLVRSGDGAEGTIVEVLYAPPIFFQVSGEEVPSGSLEQPTLVFVLSEHDHFHVKGVPPTPPRTVVRLDGGDPIEPYEVTVLESGTEFRSSQVLFPLPEGLSQATLSREKHTLTLEILLGPAEASALSWQLPLDLPGEATPASVPDAAAGVQASGPTRLPTRSQDGVQYQGRSGIRLEATYVAPEHVAAAIPEDAAARFSPDQFTVFLLTERLHTADLPSSLPDVVLRLDTRQYEPDLVEAVTTSPHHRVSLVRFPTAPPAGLRHQVMELQLPGDAVMTWHLPISYAGLGPRAGVEVTWVWVLAVLGGLVAAMWPCLFQLTVFFIPALGGLSMREASSSVSLRRRASVVKAALFFVLGFTIVYTLAGAVIGFAAERLGGMPNFEVWLRYLGIAGGIVIVVLALRAAAQVRAPLVCKMPLLSGMGHRNRPTNPMEMMIAGVAFATGCMTCFGAAVVVAMVVYVGLSGSALIGALTLFLFSMGMGIPLVIAAVAMSKVLPLLERFERAVRWMGLASSLVMLGFAVLLITGNYMVLTEWVYRALPGLVF